MRVSTEIPNGVEFVHWLWWFRARHYCDICAPFAAFEIAIRN